MGSICAERMASLPPKPHAKGSPRSPHKLAARSRQHRFLDAYGEGVLHLGFDVPECDEADKTGAKG
ncbi:MULTISPECIES: hypothetical protein [Rhizobium]|nr:MULTISPECIES: hypothetical protein [Rhizobium]WEA27904.1 hypothetical protein PO862_09545 [Rhizobium sp. MJ22]